MIEELRTYINNIFESAPKTRAVYELKEELIANSTERYLDLIEEKIPEKEALDIVINSIGDIDELFMDAGTKVQAVPQDHDTLKKTALYKSLAIGMYIIGFGVMITLSEFTPYGDLGFILMILIAAIATCILVYVSMAYPNYKKRDETVVEEFKEWNSSQKRNKSIRESVNVIIWMITLILYFVISFTTMAWYITWITFLIGVCAQAIVNLLFQLHDYK